MTDAPGTLSHRRVRLSWTGALTIVGTIVALILARRIFVAAHRPLGWAVAAVVAAVLLIGAGLVALGGKKEVQQATPPAPERAIAGVHEDVATIKGEHR